MIWPCCPNCARYVGCIRTLWEINVNDLPLLSVDTPASLLVLFLGVHHPADEQDAAGEIVANQE